MRTYRSIVSLRDVSGNIPTATTAQLNEIMGFLKPKAGQPSAFVESLRERKRERRREDQKYCLFLEDARKKRG